MVRSGQEGVPPPFVFLSYLGPQQVPECPPALGQAAHHPRSSDLVSNLTQKHLTRESCKLSEQSGLYQSQGKLLDSASLAEL